METLDAEYARAGDVALACDIFRPDGASHQTAILLLHGGGWRAGSRVAMHRQCRQLAEFGFTALAVQYRLLGQAPWPAQIDDVLTAIDWVRGHAEELGVRPDRIAVEGFSAGGHLALMAAGRSAGVAAAVAFFAPVEFAATATEHGVSAGDNLLGPDADPALLRAVSPITHVVKGYPPTFLLYGAADWLVAPQASFNMFRALTEAGTPAELHIFAEQHHEFSALPSMIAPVQAEVADFLMRQVVEPDVRRDEAERLNMFTKGPAALAEMMRAARAQ